LKLSEWFHLTPQKVKNSPSIELIRAIVSARSIKSEDEILEIQRAVNITVDMQLANMQFAHAGATEAQIAGQLHSIAIGGGGNIAFPTILTVNGETLHNHYRDQAIQAGQMVLCDCGAETSSHYGGDLTRTVPVSDQFTEQQKEIYNIVLRAQQLAIEATRPGSLFTEVHTIACEALLLGLSQIGIIKGNIKEALERDVHTLFFQCGLGHMLGMDTHDMENLGEQYVGYTDTLHKSSAFGWKSLRLARALEPGFIVTIEPGLYFIPELIDRWKAENRLIEFINYDKLEAFRHFGGIRIEDDIVVTEDGNYVLSKYLPKEVHEVEALKIKK
jgi:Xaa-Pro aminopeptidase